MPNYAKFVKPFLETLKNFTASLYQFRLCKSSKKNFLRQNKTLHETAVNETAVHETAVFKSIFIRALAIWNSIQNCNELANALISNTITLRLKKFVHQLYPGDETIAAFGKIGWKIVSFIWQKAMHFFSLYCYLLFHFLNLFLFRMYELIFFVI